MLYEDDGESASTYKKNEYSSISFSWNETSATLTVGKRAGGGFKNMLQERTFNIILVKKGMVQGWILRCDRIISCITKVKSCGAIVIFVQDCRFERSEVLLL